MCEWGKKKSIENVFEEKLSVEGGSIIEKGMGGKTWESHLSCAYSFLENLQTTSEELTRAIQHKTTDAKVVIHGREQLLALFPGLTIDDGKFSGSLELSWSSPQSWSPYQLQNVIDLYKV